MKAIVDLQLATEVSDSPELVRCEQILNEVFNVVGVEQSKECTIRIVDNEESANLNSTYRGKQGATNVLSFPFESPVEMDIALLGDLVICAPLVLEEASEQNKTVDMHWTHLIIHGCLHLLDYDHINEVDANVMENLERQIMQNLGYPDPYQLIDPV